MGERKKFLSNRQWKYMVIAYVKTIDSITMFNQEEIIKPSASFFDRVIGTHVEKSWFSEQWFLSFGNYSPHFILNTRTPNCLIKSIRVCSIICHLKQRKLICTVVISHLIRTLVRCVLFTTFFFFERMPHFKFDSCFFSSSRVASLALRNNFFIRATFGKTIQFCSLYLREFARFERN